MIDFIDYFSRTELIDILIIGIIAIIIQKSLLFSYIYIKNAIFTHRNFTLSGIWLANFFSYEEGIHNYELVKINQNQENIRFYIEHYTNASNNVLKLLGRGIFKGSKFSSYYYPLDKSDFQNGVFILRTVSSPGRNAQLLGKYVEFETSENGEILHNEDYVLKRIELPIRKRIKMKFHIQVFKNYDDMHNFYSLKISKNINELHP